MEDVGISSSGGGLRGFRHLRHLDGNLARLVCRVGRAEDNAQGALPELLVITPPTSAPPRVVGVRQLPDDSDGEAHDQLWRLAIERYKQLALLAEHPRLATKRLRLRLDRARAVRRHVADEHLRAITTWTQEDLCVTGRDAAQLHHHIALRGATYGEHLAHVKVELLRRLLAP